MLTRLFHRRSLEPRKAEKIKDVTFFFPPPLVWSHCRENLNLGNSTLKEEEVMSQRRARLNQSALITAGTAAAAETLVDSKAASL